MNKLHANTIISVIKKAGFEVSKNSANGKIRGHNTSSGDVSVTSCGDNSFRIASRKGNTAKVLGLLSNNGFKVSTFKNAFGFESNKVTK